MATLGLSDTEKAAVEAFRRDVVDPSRTSLVIVDFWAEWCGPCKQLAPVIEKVCADYAAKGVKLVKVNVDENGFIASQFRVQSIPTVYAVFQGQPVADLSQARTEGQFKQYLDQLLAQLPIESDEKALQQEVAPLIAMGEEMLAGGEHERALSIFSQIAEMDPDNAEVISGQARALIALGQLDEAEALIASLPPEVAKHPAIDQARAAIALKREARPMADLSDLESKVTADPDDHQARFDLAAGLMGNGDRDGAADMLLESVRRDRAWNDGAARAQLVKIFEAVGLEDPWVAAQRRKLSQILFA